MVTTLSLVPFILVSLYIPSLLLCYILKSMDCTQSIGVVIHKGRINILGTLTREPNFAHLVQLTFHVRLRKNK